MLPGTATGAHPSTVESTTTSSSAPDTEKGVRYPVIVTVQPLSATQKVVTLEGRLKVLNALETAVWSRVEAAPFSQLQTVSPGSCSPSVLCDTARLQVAAVTPAAAALYRDVDLTVTEPAVVALGATHAWCSVLHESVCGVTRRTLVVLAPVFCVRSLLPAPLELREASGGESRRLAGRGAVQQLGCDPAAAHRLTMKLGAGAEWSSPTVSLSVGALEESAALLTVPPLPELVRLLTAGPPDWLPGGSALETVDQPDIQLGVAVTRRWPWLNTLLLDIRPGLLVTNECGEALTLRCGSRDAAACLLPPGGVLAPPAADGALYISVLVGQEEFQASRLVLGEQQWPYQRPPPGGLGVLPPQGAVPLEAFVRQQVALFTVGSTLRGGLRHIHIHPRVVAVNETGRRLPLAALAAGGAAAEPGGRLPEVRGRHLSAAAAPQPLLWWQLAAGIAPDPAAAPLPLRLLLDLSGCRHRPLQLPAARGSCVLHGPGQPSGRCLNSLLRLAHTQSAGRVFLAVREEQAPFLLVRNDTQLPVTVCRPEPADPAEVFVSGGPPGEVPAGHSLFLPEPEPGAVGAEEARCRLHLSVGSGPGAEGTPVAGTGASLTTADRASVDLTYGNAQFLHVAGHDLTAHVHVQGHTHHVQLRPVSRLEVSAQDVRARLSRSLGSGTAERPAAPSRTKTADTPPAQTPETAAETPETPETAGLAVQLTAVCDQLSVVLQDETESVRRRQEVLRVTADRLALLLCPAAAAAGSPCRLSVCVADLQLDSQLPPAAGQLYQVLLAAQQPPAGQPQPPLSGLPSLPLIAAVNSLRRSALLLLELGLQPDAAGSNRLRSLRLQARPLRLFVEDRCHAAYAAYVRRLVAAAGSAGGAPTEGGDGGGLPAEVRAELAALCSQVLADQLTVEPLALTLSVRTHRRLYLSIDDSPLQLPAFQRVRVRLRLERLLDELVHHYMWSAIYKAGGVLASLDLLGDPAGLARSLSLGVRDLVQLPYRGLLTGPAGLVTGCGRGLASLARHLTAGALHSVSGLAAALAHNLHRLSLDADHLARTEQQLSAAPAGLADGLRQGLTGLGLALLGAVAGLADQPLQGAIEGRSAGALVGGLGRGLMGALTKPLGGAADLLAHTGQGLLHSAGWRRRLERRHEDGAVPVGRSAPAPLWYCVQMAADGAVLAVADATLLVDSRPPSFTAVTVLLTASELRLLTDLSSEQQQQQGEEGGAVCCTAVYRLSVTELVPSESDPTELTVRGRPGQPGPAAVPQSPLSPFTSSATLSAQLTQAEATHSYVAEYVRGGGAGCVPAPAEGAVLATLLLSPERRPLLVSAFRAAQRLKLGTGFPLQP